MYIYTYMAVWCLLPSTKTVTRHRPFGKRSVLGMAWHAMAWHAVAWHATAWWHSMAWQAMAWLPVYCLHVLGRCRVTVMVQK